jgi:hypothetical protein
MLRILSHTSAETLSIYPQRLGTNRGNSYLAPGALSRIASDGIFPNFDCKNTDYTEVSQDPDEDEIRLGTPPQSPTVAPCVIQGPYPEPSGEDYGGGRYPHVFADP